MKKLIPVLVVILSVCNSYAIMAQGFSGPVVRKVVIDPGHGGHDPGALSPDRKLREKDINLSVAKHLGAEISKKYSDIKVIYTRTADVAVDLDKRGTLATREDADLFISIHVNSAKRTTSVPVGPETWVFGGDRSRRKDDSYDVVLKENEVIKFEENYEAKYEGFDPDNPESMIVFNFQKDAIMRQSRILGSCIQQSLRRSSFLGGQNDRGLKEGGFVVLAYCSMPAILVEMGFLNSSADRKILSTENGRRNIARQLMLGFEEYLESYGENGLSAVNTEVPEIQYRVQILSTREALPASHETLKAFPATELVVCNDQIYKYKYTLGNFPDREDAQEYCNNLRKSDFPDAFVIAVKDGKLVPAN